MVDASVFNYKNDSARSNKRYSCRVSWHDICGRFSYSCYAFLAFIYIFASICDAKSTPFYNSKFPSANDVWENELYLADDGSFIVQWTPGKERIQFRVTARTGGYIGFGLSSTPKMDGADIVVGWVHSGKAYLQDRHGEGNRSPLVDKQQDWDLIGGYENDTHTVLIMSRPYVTCDLNDHAVTNDTVHLLWAFHADDPVDPESPQPRLHYHGGERRGSTVLFLLQRTKASVSGKTPAGYVSSHRHHKSFHVMDTPLLSWSLVQPAVTIGPLSDSVHWCRVFKRPRLIRKHHITRYEPVITPGNKNYVHHMMLYECVRLPPENEMVLNKLSESNGNYCTNSTISQFLLSCNHVLVAWSVGSEGVWLPSEAGYPMTPEGPAFYVLETHYDTPDDEVLVDASGIRLEYTPVLRHYDAGVLSVGLDPNWKHLIPPRQNTVISEGHCIKECLEDTLPPSGINVFGIIFHTHLLGKAVMLRHIRGNQELEPLAKDSNYHFGYQEFRAFRKSRKVMPGDHLIGQCKYNSQERSSITLGGFKTRDEMCLSYLFYWPRIDLSFCHSKPSLGTVLQSLGIEELSDEQNHITIKKPKELAGKSLKWRLQNYDWVNQFEHFQKATRTGTFNPLCIKRGGSKTQNSGEYEYSYPTVSNIWKREIKCESQSNNSHHSKQEHGGLSIKDDQMVDDDSRAKPIEMIDVDPIKSFDVFMPVIGGDRIDQFESTKQQQINELLEELEDVERELESELSSKHKNSKIYTQRTKASSSSAVKKCFMNVFMFIIPFWTLYSGETRPI